MAEDVKGSDGVAEGSSDFFGGAVFEEVGAEGLVEAMFGMARLLEEAAALD